MEPFNTLEGEFRSLVVFKSTAAGLRFDRFFREFIQLLPNGRYRVNSRFIGDFMKNGYRFPKAVHRLIGPPRQSGKKMQQVHRDFAFALQRRVEEAVVHVTKHLHTLTGSKNLCMAGGVALNAVANGKVQEHSGFENIFVQPAAHDAGTSLGAAAYLHYHHLRRDRPEAMSDAYLGPTYNDNQIQDELTRIGSSYTRIDKPATVAAQLIASKKVIGWFQGRAEFGPRALGAREYPRRSPRCTNERSHKHARKGARDISAVRSKRPL